MNGYEGWASLGQMLAGGDRRGIADAYDDQYDRRARREKLLQDAAQARMKSIAMHGLGSDLGAIGLENPDSLANLIRAGAANFPQLLSGLETQQGMGIRNEALGLARSGADVPGMNRLISVLSERPFEATKIAGQNLYDPSLPPTQEVATTPQGLANIAADAALVRQRDAAAARSARPPAGRSTRPEDPVKAAQDLVGLASKLDDYNDAQLARWREFGQANGEPPPRELTLADLPGMEGLDFTLKQPSIEPVFAGAETGINPPARTPGVAAAEPDKPPAPGARRSPTDGQWYVPDPNRPGRYLVWEAE